MDAKVEDAGKCPVRHTKFRSNRDWWPDALDISVLHRNSSLSDPMGEAFDYAEQFKSSRSERRHQRPERADDRLRRNGGQRTSAITVVL